MERHNAILEDVLLKVLADSQCHIDVALAWSVSAKNALHNCSGFSPNQLVFGFNPNLPSILNNKPPALRSVTSSQLVADNLSALHMARKAFVESEASRKLKSALNRQTRSATSKSYVIGDSVYYKRKAEKEWRGPGKIIGIDGKVILVRHGGQVVSVSVQLEESCFRTFLRTKFTE